LVGKSAQELAAGQAIHLDSQGEQGRVAVMTQYVEGESERKGRYHNGHRGRFIGFKGRHHGTHVIWRSSKSFTKKLCKRTDKNKITRSEVDTEDVQQDNIGCKRIK
jgi:hypothetical protein